MKEKIYAFFGALESLIYDDWCVMCDVLCVLIGRPDPASQLVWSGYFRGALTTSPFIMSPFKMSLAIFWNFSFLCWATLWIMLSTLWFPLSTLWMYIHNVAILNVSLILTTIISFSPILPTLLTSVDIMISTFDIMNVHS